MKHLKLYALASLLGLFLSCEATKDAATTTPRETSGGRNPAGTTKVVTPSKTERPARGQETANRSEMYKEIGMTTEQIKQFENAWSSSNAGRGRSNNETNSYEKIEKQDKIMKEILNAQQFKRYQKWVLKQNRN